MTSKELITELYIGYFDRAPDPVGLEFWIGVLEDGLSLDAIAQDFATQAETKTTYPFLVTPPTPDMPATDAEVDAFVTAIYDNLFDRAPDTAGFDFWTGVLKEGFSPGTFILAIIEGASEADRVVLDNKVDVACAWSDAATAEADFALSPEYIADSGVALGEVSDDPATVTAGTDAAALFFQDAPSIALTAITTTLAEDADLTAALKVADIVVTDDGVGTNVLALTGDDADLFEIDGTELFLKAGGALDFETNATLDVSVTVDDAGIGSTPDGMADLSIALTDVNDAPSVVLSNTVTAISEDADTSAALKVADIVVGDDATGTNDLTLSGADATLFEIVGTELLLKAGTALNFEDKATFDVAVEVDDATVGTSPDGTAALSVAVTDVNEVPTLSLSNEINMLSEAVDTSSAVKVADIVITDDGLGTNTLALSGADAGLFQIIGSALFVKAGTALDFETNTALDVTVTVDDATVGTSPDDSVSLNVVVTDANETPTVALTGTVTSLAENTSTASAIKVADIVVSDDGQGANTLALSGVDAGLFAIVGTELFLKAGTPLDFESIPGFEVAVTVDDASIGSTPDATTTLSLAVTDVNEAPSVSVTPTVTSFLETEDTSVRIKVADAVLTDDALGTTVLSLTGADAGLFELDGTEVFLKAGAVLDFETNPVLDVSVAADDATLGGFPDAVADLSILVTDINGAPSVALINVPASLSEDIDITARVKVADIVVTDDVTGTNTLALTGADAALFEIDGGGLFLKAGTVLDFESDPVLDVSVTVDDVTLGAGVDDTATASIAVTNVNETPTVSLTLAITSLSESANTVARIKVADIVVSDDILGTNSLGLAGADAGLFEIDGAELFLKAGTALDFETNALLNVAVTVDDATIVGVPDGTAPLALPITNVNETPSLTLSGAQSELFEGTNTTNRVQVATIVLNDDGTGTNTLALTGADAGLFEIAGSGLFLKAGTVLDVDTNPVLDVSVTVDDAAIAGTPDDSVVLSVAVTPGAPGAASATTEALTFIGNASGSVRFGQIEVPDADPVTPGNQPGFVFNTNADDVPYAGVAGEVLSLIDTTGHEGLVNLGVIADVEGAGLNAADAGFLLDNSGSAGDVFACFGEADVFGTLVTPELEATGEWIFDNTGAAGEMEITFKQVDLNAGGLLTFLNVDVVIAGDIDLTILGDDLTVDAASTLEVAAGGTLTLTVEQVDNLEDAGVVIFGAGAVVVTGAIGEDGTAATDEIDTDFGILQTATVDLSAVTLSIADSDGAVGITVSGAASDDAGTDLMVDGVRVAQTVIGTVENDAVTVAFSAGDGDLTSLDVILRLGADSGDIGDPLDTPVGVADPAEVAGDTVNLDVALSANVLIEVDAGFDAVVGSGFSNRVDAQVASGAEFYAPLLAGNHAASAASSNAGTAVLEAVGLTDREIDVSAAGGGWTLLGAQGSTETILTGGAQADILVDGVPDDGNNNNEEDTLTGGGDADLFQFNVALSDVGTFTTAPVAVGVDLEEIAILGAMANPADGTLQFNMRIGAFAPAQVLLVDGVDSADLSSAAGIATALNAALNARADVTSSLSGTVVTASGVNGGRLDLINIIEDPAGNATGPTPLVAGVAFNYDNLTDIGNYANDAADTGDDDRTINVIDLAGPIAVGETYTVEVTRSDGSQFTGTFVTTTMVVQDAVDGLADALNVASGGTIGFSSLMAAVAAPVGTNALPTAAVANQIVAYDNDADNGGFIITGASGTATISGASSSSLLTGSGTLVSADADVVTDFLSGTDTISFGLGAGTNSNYDEGAEVANFNAAETAANAAMDGTVIYYLTSSAVTSEEGLLFFDANGDGTADGVVSLVGIDSSIFDDADIV